MTLREVEKWYTKVSLQPSLVDGGGVYTKPSLQPTLTWGRSVHETKFATNPNKGEDMVGSVQCTRLNQLFASPLRRREKQGREELD